MIHPSSFNRMVPITPRFALLFVLALIVLTAPLWWPRLTASAADKEPDLTGKWVGTVHVTKYIEGIGRVQPVDKLGTFSMTLEVYDGVIQRYRGNGYLQLPGEEPRPIKITDIILSKWFNAAQQAAHPQAMYLEGAISGNLHNSGPAEDPSDIQGSASAVQIQFETVALPQGYSFRADLHR